MLRNNMKLTIPACLIGALAVGLISDRAAWSQPATGVGVGVYKVFTTTRDEEVPARDEKQASDRLGHMDAEIAIIRTDKIPIYGLSLYIPHPQHTNNAMPGDGFVCNDAERDDTKLSWTCSRTASSGRREELSVGLAGSPFCSALRDWLPSKQKHVIVDAAGCEASNPDKEGHPNSTCICYYVGPTRNEQGFDPPNSGTGSGRN